MDVRRRQIMAKLDVSSFFLIFAEKLHFNTAHLNTTKKQYEQIIKFDYGNNVNIDQPNG
jgi:hypothetical protein